MADSRYPYTYSADYIRSLAGYGTEGTILSRGDASRIKDGIAQALGMTEKQLAEKLADYYKQHEAEISESSAKELMVVLEQGQEAQR